MILKWILRKQSKLCNGLQSVPDRVQRRASEKIVMNLWTPWNIKERFCLAEPL